jgi:predicted enzyme related to lactoylglutathione lyase
MIKRLDAVLLNTSKFDRLVNFYRDVVGLDLKIDNHSENRHADTEELGIHFAIWPDGPGSPAAKQITLALLVDNIDKEYTRLCNMGVKFNHPPQRFPFGGTVASFDDPDGNQISLVIFD